MEGLIPMVYKRIKRSVSHRHYKCLSTTGGADFFLPDVDPKFHRSSTPLPEGPPPDTHADVYGLRRSSSLVESRVRPADERPCGFGGSPGGHYLGQDPARFRTHHRSVSMFSCITG